MRPLESDECLEYFQARLLVLLDSELNEFEIKKALLEDPGLQEYKDYIESWQPQMLDLAKQLTKKWGLRRTEFE